MKMVLNEVNPPLLSFKSFSLIYVDEKSSKNLIRKKVDRNKLCDFRDSNDFYF